MDRRCFSEFIRYASLNILGMLGLSCYILADTFFIANRLGADGLAALNLAIPVYSLIHGCGLMIGMGGSTRYAILRSRNSEGDACTVFTHALYLWGVCSVLFVLCGLVASGAIAALLGAQGRIFTMSRTYLQMLLLFSPAFLLNDILLGFVRSDGAPQLVMAAMLTGSFSNILLDYVLIYTADLGIFGAVLATCLAPLISMAVLSVFFLQKRHHFRPVRRRPSVRSGAKLLVTGFPSLAAELSSGVVMIAFNFLMLEFSGSTGVATYGVIANISLVVIAVFTGMAQGIQPVLSRYFGAGERRRLRFVLRCALWSTVLLSVLLTGGILLAADPIAAAFNAQEDPTLQQLAVQGLRLYFLGTLPAGVNLVLCAYCASAERSRAGNAISVLRGFLLILPLAFLLSAAADLTGLWLAFPLTELLTLVLAAVLLRKKSAFP